MQKPNIDKVCARLNISELPSLTDSMSKGGMYALITETPPTRFPILASCLHAALQDGLPCTVILPDQAATFLERLESFAPLHTNDAISEGKLQVLLCQNDFTKNMFRFGADTFAKELDHFDTRPNGLLIFDKADDLFSLHDVSLALNQADTLADWCAERNVTALLCFSHLSSAAASTLQSLMDKLSGMVHLDGDRDGLGLSFDYWQSPEGTIAAKHYPLTPESTGRYKAIRLVEQTNPGFDLPAQTTLGEQKYYYMNAQLHSMYQQLPGEWQYVDSLVSVVYATRGNPLATVVLSYDKATNLRELAETVHTLRLGLGKRACIVVHEQASSLRYQNEALLLRLGVNLVIHRDVATGRLPLLLESVKGQVFERNMEVNFEAALASVFPSSLRGYQPPARFSKEIHNILERSERINIPSTLLIGVPVNGTDIGELLSGIVLSRAGDLSCSDGECCYLFLNGCPESAILVTIERLLGMDIDAIFQSHRFVTRKHDIQAELDALNRTATVRELPDYSEQARSNTPDGNVAIVTKQIQQEKPELPVLKAETMSHTEQVEVAQPIAEQPQAARLFAQSPLIRTASAAPKLAVTTPAAVASAPEAAVAPQTPVQAKVVAPDPAAGSTGKHPSGHIVFGKDPVPRAKRSIDSTHHNNAR